KYILSHVVRLAIDDTIAQTGLSRSLNANVAKQIGQQLDRLSKLSEVRVSFDVTSGFGIEKDGSHDGLEVTANTRSVVIENSCDACNIGWRRVACYKMLDHD